MVDGPRVWQMIFIILLWRTLYARNKEITCTLKLTDGREVLPGSAAQGCKKTLAHLIWLGFVPEVIASPGWGHANEEYSCSLRWGVRWMTFRSSRNSQISHTGILTAATAVNLALSYCPNHLFLEQVAGHVKTLEKTTSRVFRWRGVFEHYKQTGLVFELRTSDISFTEIGRIRR